MSISSIHKALAAVALPVFIFLSCAGNATGNKNTGTDTAAIAAAPVYDTSLAKGGITDSILCRGHNDINYALYLPSYYTPSRPFPCIVFFDSHARGSLPLKSYQHIAERYGFILFGSNVSKNGLPFDVVNNGVIAMLSDIKSRFNIDARRLYTSGFSGGSRVAGSVAIADGGVAGVIGCAAGLPSLQQSPGKKFDYFGIAGVYDFNMPEMAQQDAALAQGGFNHQFISFVGIHSWPPAADFETAVLWMQVSAMKEKIQPRNDTIITALKTDMDKRIAAAGKDKDWLKMYGLIAGVARVFDGLMDVAPYQQQLTDLDNKTEYKNAVTLQQQLLQQEGTRQQELAAQFAQHDVSWWTKKIAELNNAVKTAKDHQQAQMYQRLVNYLGLVGYMNSSHALSTGDLANAANFIKIFKTADPKNPDCDYLQALWFVKSGNEAMAIASLNESAKLGYTDAAQLINEPAFATLQSNPSFKAVVEAVKENYADKKSDPGKIK